MNGEKLFLYKLFERYVFNVHGTADTAQWLIMLQVFLGFFLPMMTLYKLLNRRSTLEKWLCCIMPFVLTATVSIMETIMFSIFCSKSYSPDVRLAWFLNCDDFFVESLILCGIFLICSVLFTIISRRAANASVFQLVLNQIVEYLIMGMVLWFSWDYLVKGGTAFFEISDMFIRWYIYGLWILVRQSAFYLLCIICFLVFYERRPKFTDGNYVSSEDWFAHYLSDNYRGPGISVLLYGLLFCWMSVASFDEGREIKESYYMGFVIAAVAAVITFAGLLMVFFAIFPKLLGSFKMLYKGQNTERMVTQLYKELEQERPLVEFGFGRGFITRNFIVLYLPLRIYYIPFCYMRKGTWFYFSDGRKFFVHECDARTVRRFVR